VRKALFALSILAFLGAWGADTLLQGFPGIRNGWWSLAFFALPLGLLALAWRGPKGKLGWAAAGIVLLGVGSYGASRTVFGRVSGTPAVAVGDKAPDFTLRDPKGQEVSLSELASGHRVVLVFFRGRF
jgi:hypothetical protein